MKILVVEDKPTERAAALNQLSGHELSIVDDFYQAVKSLDKNDFDVVLTDLLMPRSPMFSGGETLHPYGIAIALKALSKGVQKIAIVSYGGSHDHDMITGLGQCFFESTLLDKTGARLLMFLNSGCRETDGCILWEGNNKEGWKYVSKDWAEALKRLSTESATPAS